MISSPSSEIALKLGDLKPHQLVSLFDMRRISRDSIKLLDSLGDLLSDNHSNPDEPLTSEQVEKFRAHQGAIYKLLGGEGLNLEYSFRKFVRLRARWREGITLREHQERVRAILELIEDEIIHIYFCFIPKEKVVFLVHPFPFGVVYSKFPSARYDIEQGRFCFAHDLFTASVFHMMRVAEIGTRALIIGLKAKKHLTKPIELSDWGALHAALQEGLKALRVNSRTTTARKDKYEFYNEAAAHFMYLKEAWRNNVSHTRTEYREHDALAIVTNTEQFMKHLAKRLSEKPAIVKPKGVQ